MNEVDRMDEERLQRELREELDALGLKQYEARTLIALVQLGTATAKQIATVEEVPRTRVYDAAERLQEMGLVDVQYASPRKFAVISRESIVRKLETSHRNRIDRLGALLDALDTREPETEEFGTWTVTGRDAVAQRVYEFVDQAGTEVVYLTVDDLLSDEHIDHLRTAADRGVHIAIGGLSPESRERIQARIPDAEPFETLWEWSDPPAGSLLVTDNATALVSVRVEDGDGSLKEIAIWGTGEHNSLVVVLRAIFTWRLERFDPADDTPGNDT
jgi:sugar-specific transcriptional regulator TrmB